MHSRIFVPFHGIVVLEVFDVEHTEANTSGGKSAVGKDFWWLFKCRTGLIWDTNLLSVLHLHSYRRYVS